MTNKQLYNLVFENFVQAKKELIREGYLKRNLDEVDFNEIFDQTKKRMLEEKVKKLQRENEMLKSQLSKRKSLEETFDDGHIKDSFEQMTTSQQKEFMYKKPELRNKYPKIAARLGFKTGETIPIDHKDNSSKIRRY